MAVVLTEKVVSPKGVIYYQGNQVEEIFFVQQGQIKVAHLTQLLLICACGCTVKSQGKSQLPLPPSLLAMLCCVLICRL